MFELERLWRSKRLKIGLVLVVLVLLSVLMLIPIISRAIRESYDNASVPTSPEVDLLDDPRLEFTLEYPKQWKVDNLPYSLHGDLTAKVAINLPSAFVIIIREPSSSSFKSLEQLLSERHQMEQYEANRIRRSILYNTESLSPISVDGRPILVGEYTKRNTGVTPFDALFGPHISHTTDVAFQHKDNSYLIAFDSEMDIYPKMEGVINRMIHSIKFR